MDQFAAGISRDHATSHLTAILRRADDVDDRLAFLHVDRPQTALECRHHFSRIGDFLTVAVGNLDGLLVSRDVVLVREPKGAREFRFRDQQEAHINLPRRRMARDRIELPTRGVKRKDTK